MPLRALEGKSVLEEYLATLLFLQKLTFPLDTRMKNNEMCAQASNL